MRAGGALAGEEQNEPQKKAGVKAAIPLLKPEMTITDYRFDGQQWFIVSHKKLEYYTYVSSFYRCKPTALRLGQYLL